VPLNDDAYAVIERRLLQGKPYVFTREGNSGRIMQHDRRVFERACRN
jgi:hypothetical protein